MDHCFCNVCNIFIDVSIKGFPLHAKSHFRNKRKVGCPVCCKEFQHSRPFNRHIYLSNCTRTIYFLDNQQLVSVRLPEENVVIQEQNDSESMAIDEESIPELPIDQIIASPGNNQNDEVYDIESQANEELLNDDGSIVHESFIDVGTEDGLLSEFVRTMTECSARHGITDVGITDIVSKMIEVLHDTISNRTLNVDKIMERMLEISKSAYIRNQLISKLKTYVKPVEVTVGTSKFYIIPPSKSIKAALTNKNLLEDIIKNMNHDRRIDVDQNKIYHSRKDGESFQNLDKHILHITLWVDDVNASRSFTRLSKHNLFVISMCIDNISYNISKYSKQLDLVVIGMRDDVNKNDALRICINRIVDDLKELQKDGIDIFHNGKLYHFIPKLLSICGDNRAKPEIIGYNYVSIIMF